MAYPKKTTKAVKKVDSKKPATKKPTKVAGRMRNSARKKNA